MSDPSYCRDCGRLMTGLDYEVCVDCEVAATFTTDESDQLFDPDADRARMTIAEALTQYRN